MIHTFHLASLGFSFSVHPTAFLVHVPHPRAAAQAITADTGHRQVLEQRYVEGRHLGAGVGSFFGVKEGGGGGGGPIIERPGLRSLGLAAGGEPAGLEACTLRAG